MPRVLFLTATSGSNAELSDALSPVAEACGAETETLDLSALNLPLFTPERQSQTTPQAALDLAAKMRAADALVLLAPEYNGGIPPTVTNALAWMSVSTKDFRASVNGKFAIVGTHSGGGGHHVIAAMRSQLAYLGMIVLARSFQTNKTKAQSPDSARAIFTQLMELLGKRVDPS